MYMGKYRGTRRRKRLRSSDTFFPVKYRVTSRSGDPGPRTEVQVQSRERRGHKVQSRERRGHKETEVFLISRSSFNLHSSERFSLRHVTLYSLTLS